MTDKHAECSHTLSLSGKLLYCFQMVYCGNQDYLIIKTTDSNEIIYASIISNGFTFFNDFDIYWQNSEEDDILVYDITYSFLYDNGQLALIDAEEILYEGIDEKPNYLGYSLMVKKEDIYQEHRLIKYKRDYTQQNKQSYSPFGHIKEFNCEMVVVDDIQGETCKCSFFTLTSHPCSCFTSKIFKKWKQQEKRRIYVKDSPDNPQHPKHSEWLDSKDYNFIDYDWFITETPWQSI
jgi:hypothetical protein